jgi:hypothetical protein
VIAARSAHRHRLPDWLPWVLLLAVVGRWSHATFPITTGDLFHTQFAAYEWHVGTPEKIYSTYDPADHNRWMVEWNKVAAHLDADSLPYLHFYPPFVSASLAPLADVPARYWRDVMLAANLLMILALAYQTVRLCDVRVTSRALLWALMLVLLTNGVASTVNFGQASMLLAVMIWAGLLLIRRNDHWLGGGLIGAAATFKLTPLSLLVYPGLRNRWKAVIAGAVIFAGIFLISWAALGTEIHRAWWSATRSAGHYVWTCGLDQSVTAWFARAVLGHSLLAGGFPETPLIASLRLVSAVVFTGLSVFLLWIRRRDLVDEHFTAAIGLLMCGVMLSLPFVWNYYFVLPLPVLGWAIYASWQAGARKFWSIWLGIAAFFFCVRLYRFYDDTVIGSFFSGSHTIGLLMLWGWLIQRVLGASGTSGGRPEAAHSRQTTAARLRLSATHPPRHAS